MDTGGIATSIESVPLDVTAKKLVNTFISDMYKITKLIFSLVFG